MWTKVGEQFPRDSVESFSEAAKRYLSDKSNLSSRTLEAADWTTLYGEFTDN